MVLAWKNRYCMRPLKVDCMDWTMQNAERQHELITEHGLPVRAMEPEDGS